MSATYRISVDVGVQDPVALWTMVSELLAGVYGMSDEDIVDTIGPRQDPDICQCMTMLLDPTRWNGCVVEGMDCAKAPETNEKSATFTPRVVESAPARSRIASR